MSPIARCCRVGWTLHGIGSPSAPSDAGTCASKKSARREHACAPRTTAGIPRAAASVDLPAGRSSIGSGIEQSGIWWVKFSLDTGHDLVWRVVQELGHVLNYLSLDERLPTVVMPVSPPPYMNGGVEFLSWVIESKDPDFTPAACAKWLEGRLPRPVDDLDAWRNDDQDAG